MVRLLQVDSVTDALFVKLDTDGDGTTDKTTTVVEEDTDGDGYLDGEEVENGYDPIVRGSATLKDRKSQNITIEYFSWTKEKYGIKDPILKDSSINEFINLNLSAIRIGHLCGEDLIRAFR